MAGEAQVASVHSEEDNNDGDGEAQVVTMLIMSGCMQTYQFRCFFIYFPNFQLNYLRKSCTHKKTSTRKIIIIYHNFL
jgi:hypothetical protein